MHLNKARIALAATALATLGGAGVAASANASPADVQAITSNAQEFVSDTLSNVGGSDNITCSQPATYGSAVLQETNAVVAQLFGEDEAVAHLECASLTPSTRYTITGTLYIQAFIGGAWQTVRTSPTKVTSSTDGAAAQTITLTGTYDPPDPALGYYHRAKVVFTLSTGRVYKVPSPSVWFMKE